MQGSEHEHLGERLEQFIAATGLKKSAIAAALGIQPSQLSRYLGADGQMPQREPLEQLAAMGCNLHWLITGEGEMMADNQAGRTLQHRLGSSSDGQPVLVGNAESVLSTRVISMEDVRALESLLHKLKEDTEGRGEG